VTQRLIKNVVLDAAGGKLDEVLRARAEREREPVQETPKASREELRLLEQAGRVILEERARVVEAARKGETPPPGNPGVWRDFVLMVSHAHGEGCNCALCQFAGAQLLTEAGAVGAGLVREAAVLPAPTKSPAEVAAE